MTGSKPTDWFLYDDHIRLKTTIVRTSLAKRLSFYLRTKKVWKTPRAHLRQSKLFVGLFSKEYFKISKTTQLAGLPFLTASGKYNKMLLSIPWTGPKVNVQHLLFVQLTHFMPLVSFDTPWKHQKTFGFLMFSEAIEKDHWHEMN